jgi:tRNA nucleotidyltransferase (CCA-adding enzyme)
MFDIKGEVNLKPKVLITTHKNPDFDAFAASIAASLLYQDSVIIIDSEPQQNLKEFLNIYDIPYKKAHEFDEEFEEQIKNKNFEKIVIVDTSDINRIPDSIRFLVEEGVPVDIYDHHPELKEQNINGNNFSKPVGSSTTILTEILFEKGIYFSDTIKTLFLIAIHEDTGNFVYPTTSWEDHDIAAKLIKAGARVEEVEEFVSLEMTQDQKLLFDKLYNNIEEFYLDEICVNIAYAESEKFIGGLNIITHKLFETLTPDVLFVVVKIARTIYIVARSKSNQIDLNKIMTSFGGGGHKKAGAAKVKDQRFRFIKNFFKLLS